CISSSRLIQFWIEQPGSYGEAKARMIEGTTPPGAPKAWAGRFSTAPDRRSEAFTSSITFDHRLVLEDIRGSVAHVRMLGRQNIVTPAEAAEIEDGLWRVWDEAADGT